MAMRGAGRRRPRELPRLPSAASQIHPAAGRPRPLAVGAVSDHQGELPPQGDPRSHRTDLCQAAAAAVAVAVQAPGRDGGLVARKLRRDRPREDGALSRPERPAVRPVLARRRRHLVFRRLAGRDGDLAVAGDAHPQHRRARLHLDRRRPIQPRPHHIGQPDRAAIDRAVLGRTTTPNIICSCTCRATGCRKRTGC